MVHLPMMRIQDLERKRLHSVRNSAFRTLPMALRGSSSTSPVAFGRLKAASWRGVAVRTFSGPAERDQTLVGQQWEGLICAGRRPLREME